MTNYREILRLKSLGINNQPIAQGMVFSRTTLRKLGKPESLIRYAIDLEKIYRKIHHL